MVQSHFVRGITLSESLGPVDDYRCLCLLSMPHSCNQYTTHDIYRLLQHSLLDYLAVLAPSPTAFSEFIYCFYNVWHSPSVHNACYLNQCHTTVKPPRCASAGKLVYASDWRDVLHPGVEERPPGFLFTSADPSCMIVKFRLAPTRSMYVVLIPMELLCP